MNEMRSAGRSVGWLVGRSVSWSAGRSVGWLVGRSDVLAVNSYDSWIYDLCLKLAD